MLRYLFKFLRLIIPKNEVEKILDEIINELKNNPINYIKVAMLYLRLHNIYAILIGKNGDDKLNFYLANFYKKQYDRYINLLII